MNQYSLNQVYADPRVAACLERFPVDDHRTRVLRALAPAEPIHAFWWGEIGGLVLVTDRRLLQFPKMLRRRLLFGYDVHFETWAHPYTTLDRLEFVAGSFFELARVVAHKTEGDPVAIVLGKVDPAERDAFVRTIEDLLAAWRARSDAERAGLEAATPPLDGALNEEAVGLADDLQTLYDLHQNGALTDEEFRQAKAKLLEK